MATLTHDDLLLCVDCLFAAVNGYLPEDEDIGNAVEAGLERLAKLGYLVPNFDSETGDGVWEFYRPLAGCACCKSPLAGQFHRFAILA